jgi:hypothetical protein
MPMIDVYAAAGTFPDSHALAQYLDDLSRTARSTPSKRVTSRGSKQRRNTGTPRLCVLMWSTPRGDEVASASPVR